MGQATAYNVAFTTLYEDWLTANVSEDFDEAARLALQIATTPPNDTRELCAQARLLCECLRPEAMGEDQPERHILLNLEGNIARLVRI